MKLTTSCLVSAITLGFAGVVDGVGVCAGKALGIGTAKAVGANTQWNIYKSTTCAVYDTYTQNSNVTYCASSRFYCEFGTKNIAQYDDPFTGWAYNCTADAVTENCSGDNVVRCCYPFWGIGISDSNPLNH